MAMSKLLKIYGFFFLLFNLSVMSHAQTTEKKEETKPNIHLFEVVVVTAEAEKLESPTTISEVTAEELRARTTNNLGEALELLPGVQFRVGRSKNEQQVTVRGFEQENVLILMDGIPLSIPYEGQLNLHDIPAQNIESIKLVKGVASALYGANQMGGVINIISKQGEEKPHFSAQYEGSQYAIHNVQVGHGWKVGPFSYYGAFSHRESNGYPLPGTFTLPQDVLDSMAASPSNPPSIPNVPIPPNSGSRDNADYSRNAFTLTGMADLNSRNTLGVSFEYYDNEYGSPPAPIYREHKKGFFYFPRYWRFTDWNRSTVNVMEESRVSDDLTIKARFFYDAYDNLLNIYDDPTYTTQNRIGPPSGSSLYDDYDTGFSIYGYWKKISRNEMRAALNYRRDVHEETFAGSPKDRLSADTWSVGIEDEIKLNNRLALTPGISIDFYDKRERYQSSESLPPGKDISSVNPQLGVSFDASARVNLYGSVGRKSRFPTMRNLYADGVIGPQGNPDLKEESTIAVEIGTDVYASPGLTLGGAFFYNNIDGLINFDNQIGRFEQYAEAAITGFELSAKGRIADTTDAYFAYTFLRARSHSDVTIDNAIFEPLVYKPEELPYRPAHQIDFELRHRLSFGMEANLYGNFFSDSIYYDHADPNDNKRLTAIKSHLDGYFLLNAKISQKIVDGFRLYFAVENLTNKTYQTLFLYPAEGRAYRYGLRFEM
jgi:outer membrane receptor protein involved in Fe transport